MGKNTEKQYLGTYSKTDEKQKQNFKSIKRKKTHLQKSALRLTVNFSIGKKKKKQKPEDNGMISSKH